MASTRAKQTRLCPSVASSSKLSSVQGFENLAINDYAVKQQLYVRSQQGGNSHASTTRRPRVHLLDITGFVDVQLARNSYWCAVERAEEDEVPGQQHPTL